MKAMLTAALVTAFLTAASPALAQTPGNASGQQDVISIDAPAGRLEPLGANAVGKPASGEPAPAAKVPPGKGPPSTMVTPGIDPASIEAMYPKPEEDRADRRQ